MRLPNADWTGLWPVSISVHNFKRALVLPTISISISAKLAAAMCVVALLAVAGLSYTLRTDDKYPFDRQLVPLPSISDCLKTSRLLPPNESPTIVALKEAQGACYDQIFGQGLLNDFQLRRLKFVEQSYSHRVILWMVVIITLSGVFLAGIQVFASYKLASSGQSEIQTSELTIARDSLSVKSSIAGLFILIVSFAFFYVFVFEMYKIHPIDVDASSKPTDTSSKPRVGEGPLLKPLAPDGELKK